MSSVSNRNQHHFHHNRNINTPLIHALTIIEHCNSPIKFLILDCPTESTLSIYLEEFIKLNVKTVVRCCQPTYNIQSLTNKGISVIDLPFRDGGIPPKHVVDDWLNLLNQVKDKAINENTQETIAVHCVAGLGRAPVLVAIGLIEIGLPPLDAIEYIRNKRRGAFNKPQITYLDSYKPRHNSGHSFSFRTSLGKMFGFGPKPVSQQT